jgi:hypothetical protein
MMMLKGWNLSTIDILLLLLWSTSILVLEDRCLVVADDYVGISVLTDRVGGDDVSPIAATTNLATCTWENRHFCEGTYQDSNLFPMTVPLEIAESEDRTTFLAYVDPDVSTFYNRSVGSMTPKEPPFSGLFAKFINLSPKRLMVYFDSNGQRSFISELAPFQAGATASYPSHKFVATDANSDSVLSTWIIRRGKSLYEYDPYQGSLDNAAKSLSSSDFELYKLQRDNILFNQLYQGFTGREWLGLYKRKYPPRHHMWPADSFGQIHQVQTRETHLISLPPSSIALAQTSKYGSTEKERAELAPYKDPNQEILTLNLTVISVIPRAFEVQNFLSPAEVDHLLEVATGMKLGESSTGSNSESRSRGATRTSRNSWIPRERSVIVDSINRRYVKKKRNADYSYFNTDSGRNRFFLRFVLYYRAADLLQIDEALFRYRSNNETALLPESLSPIVERMQLVHYDIGQQYTVRRTL